MSITEHSANARLRELERHGAATLRAVSGNPAAEYRARRLRLDGAPAAFAAPWLAVDFSEASLVRSRGVVDSLGLRLRHSDAQLHQQRLPAGGFARLIFDVMEQLRCESMGSRDCRGLRDNLDAAFLDWCNEAHGNGLVDSSLGILLYTVVHMVRARLMGTLEDETAEALIEATRANLGPLIGKPLYHLQHVREDQAAFAEAAHEIATTLETLLPEESPELDDAPALQNRHGIVLPPDWQDDSAIDGPEEGAGGGGSAENIDSVGSELESLGDYRAYTTEFDRVETGESLYRVDRRTRLRRSLDELVAAQAVSVTRLAQEMLPLFSSLEVDGWLFGQDEGQIDARRLSQLVSNPDYRQVFVQDRLQPRTHSTVTFLIDNSGSMKRQRYAAVAVLMDTFCRALSLAGVHTEVLGFTTGDWNGGRALTAWRKASQVPEHPGRLGELLHIVYKDADTSWRRARSSLSALLETQHLREGVDGEALIWAYRRLLGVDTRYRYLVVISDGAPMDAATYNANRDGFLEDHLHQVVRHIEGDPRVQLGGIGIDLDLADTFRNSVSLDLGGTLGQASYRVLHELFAPS